MKEQIDRKGRGPGEFTGVTDMSIVSDSLYLYDSSLAKIIVFDRNNNFIRETHLPEVFGQYMVMDNQRQIYFTTPNRQYPITKFSVDEQEVVTFGTDKFNIDSDHFLRNHSCYCIIMIN